MPLELYLYSATTGFSLTESFQNPQVTSTTQVEKHMARNRSISTRGRWQQPPHRAGLAGPAQKPRAVDPAWDSLSLYTPALLTAHIRELKTVSLQLHTACALHVYASMPQPRGLPTGTCKPCVERCASLARAGFTDPEQFLRARAGGARFGWPPSFWVGT